MRIPRMFFGFIFLIVIIVVGCTSTTPEVATTVTIPSFRESYPMLVEEAQKWKPDAYLDSARIFLFPATFDAVVITASFYSPSENLESLGVDLYQDKKIITEVFTHGYPILHHKPITENDWKIDSQEALENFLSADSHQPSNLQNYNCSNMILERVLPAIDQRVIWSLTIWDCSETAQHSYLDANSGEKIDSSVINVKPTRFPTPMPTKP